jgi:disulfide bond formation protein DsbB
VPRAAARWSRASVGAVTRAATADMGRVARWTLLACTLLGLAAMHTVGHAGMQMGAHGQVMPGSTATLVVTHVAPVEAVQAVVAAVTGGCADDDCADPSHHGGAMSGWSMCLAVLSGLAVVVLLAALLLRATTGRGRRRFRAASRVVVPRGPPGRRSGLTMVAVSVLRI